MWFASLQVCVQRHDHCHLVAPNWPRDDIATLPERGSPKSSATMSRKASEVVFFTTSFLPADPFETAPI